MQPRTATNHQTSAGLERDQVASPEQIAEFDVADAKTAMDVTSGRVQALEARDLGFIGTTEVTFDGDNAEVGASRVTWLE